MVRSGCVLVRLGCALALLLPTLALAETTTLEVQGALRSNGGGPVADGNYALAVSLYDAADAKKPVFYETFLAVAVQSGMFSVTMGAGNVPLDTALFGAGKAGWLGVTVGGDPELTRKPLRPVPLAVRALTADTATVAQGLQCTGCVTAAMLAPNVASELGLVKASALAKVATSGAYGDLQGAPDLATYAKVQSLANVALTGKYADLQGGPDLTPYAKSQSLAKVATSGAYADLQGVPDLSGVAKLADGNVWQKTQTFNADTDFAMHQGLNFRLQVAATAPAKCQAGTKGLVYYDTTANKILVCNGTDFVAIGGAMQPVGTQQNPGKSCKDVLASGGNASGLYWLSQGGKTYQAYCDQTTAGGGWTLALNLDTSDGHVMWWGEALWTNASLFGKPQLLGGDFKGDAWNEYAGASKVLLVVHQNGAIKGWRSFAKADGSTLFQVFQGGDNVVLGASSLQSDAGNVWSSEQLVRSSSKLYANHCINQGSACTSGNGGSSDGDRLGSDEATPASNTGGGLGNWHDMNYCCGGPVAGKDCNGSAFRTVSEAQAGWSPCYGGQAGYFGSDTFAPGQNTCNDGNCGNANWAAPANVDYDYALFLGE